ncbi:MAG: glycine/betaine ABC transporter substrate-binding protein [Treponema sp.]|jgi:osmoprotectant transport system permease protein|nr:glycine/betaine ABC transporter substrate-binding protein [Treponema sp.]
MKRSVVVFAAVLGMAFFAGSCKGAKTSIVIGAKDFTEQDILGNMLYLLVEAHTDIKVEYKHEMSSNVVFAAIKSGDIDLYIDYTGTVYGNYLGYSEMRSAEEVYAIAVKELKDQYNLLMLESLGFNNTYTLSVRKDTAEKYGLKTYSDLAKVSQDLILGATFEVLNRNDGIPNLKKTYGMSFKDEKAIDGTLRYTAMAKDEIQVTDAFSTDGMLLEYDLLVLEDDQHFFPPYYAAPVIRAQTMEKYPELQNLLLKLNRILDDEAMRELNYRVDVLKENPTETARNFLKARGLI